MATGSSFDSFLSAQLEDPEQAVEYIRAALEEPEEDGDQVGYLMRAIGQVAKAHGVDKLADETKIPRATIYSMIKKDPNPSLKNVMKILDAVGIKISFDLKKVEGTPASVLDVAAYILQKAKGLGDKDTFWLQKLVYYSQAISLKDYSEHLFPETIEAWANGPVVRELYEKHRGLRSIKSLNPNELGDPATLSSRQRAAIDRALEKYGSASGELLSDLSHKEAPWINARVGLKPHQRSGKAITVKAMKEYYKDTDYDDFDD